MPQHKKQSILSKDGHRDRLRKRFLRDMGASMDDYELLELLLMEAISRRDVKLVAKQMINDFGSLAEVINADTSRLTAYHGVGEHSAFTLKLVAAAMQRAAQQHTLGYHVIASAEGLKDYCRVRFAHISHEEFHMIILDQQNHVTQHLCLGKGSISDVVVYPREVIKLVLDHHAASVVLIHNHPGGGTKPSINDVKTTNKLREVLRAIDVKLFDHMIVARGGEIVSFKDLGIF